MTEPQDDLVPEQPDLGASVQLEAGETLDGQPGTDAMDALIVAPNRPFGLDDPATTPDGQRDGDTLDERIAREIPDDVNVDPAGEADIDAVGGELDPEVGDRRTGRLTADATAADTWPTGEMDADDAGISGGVASAEEAAMHDIDENDIAVDDGVPDDADPLR
jgi:hypothetical protein